MWQTLIFRPYKIVAEKPKKEETEIETMKLLIEKIMTKKLTSYSKISSKMISTIVFLYCLNDYLSFL